MRILLLKGRESHSIPLEAQTAERYDPRRVVSILLVLPPRQPRPHPPPEEVHLLQTPGTETGLNTVDIT